jgi:hypothetical protein
VSAPLSDFDDLFTAQTGPTAAPAPAASIAPSPVPVQEAPRSFDRLAEEAGVVIRVPDLPSSPEDAAYLAHAASVLGPVFPTEGWLALQMKATTRHTSAAAEFHLAAGLAAIAGILGNRVYFVKNARRLFPHVWQILIADSGDSKKSSAIGYALNDLMSSVASECYLPAGFTMESFHKLLSDRPYGVIFHDEWASFTKSLAAKYNDTGLKAYITSVYESGPERSRITIGGGDLKVNWPAVSMIAGTTMTWFEAGVQPEDVETGWLNRFYFLPNLTGSAPNKPLGGDWNPDEKRVLQDGLRYLLRPEIGTPSRKDGGGTALTLAPEAQAALLTWLAGWGAEQQVGRSGSGPDMHGFGSRLENMAIKFAILNHFSRYAFDHTIPAHELDVADVEFGIAYVRLGWNNALAILDGGVAWDDMQRWTRIFLNAVGKGAFLADVATKCGKKSVHAKERAMVISNLVEQDRLIVERRTNPKSKIRETESTYFRPVGEPLEVEARPSVRILPKAA